jgi:hypothetical protein
MPEGVYRQVLFSNVRLMYVAGVHDKEYYTFLRGVGGNKQGSAAQFLAGVCVLEPHGGAAMYSDQNAIPQAQFA